MLFRGVKLLFEEQNFALQGIERGFATFCVLRQGLGLGYRFLCFFDFGLQQRDSVGQRGDLLFLLEQLLLV